MRFVNRNIQSFKWWFPGHRQYLPESIGGFAPIEMIEVGSAGIRGETSKPAPPRSPVEIEGCDLNPTR